MLYLSNAFAVGMFGHGRNIWGTKRRFESETLRPRDAGELLRTNSFVSCYGHADTAWHLSRYLKVGIPVSREPISPEPGDRILVASANRGRDQERSGCPRWSFFLISFVE